MVINHKTVLKTLKTSIKYIANSDVKLITTSTKNRNTKEMSIHRVVSRLFINNKAVIGLKIGGDRYKFISEIGSFIFDGITGKDLGNAINLRLVNIPASGVMQLRNIMESIEREPNNSNTTKFIQFITENIGIEYIVRERKNIAIRIAGTSIRTGLLEDINDTGVKKKESINKNKYKQCNKFKGHIDID